MTENEMIEYYKAETAILKHYGLKVQKQQFIQELAELIVALTKNDIDNLIEKWQMFR